ncbi:caspase family protein [Variovorax terrae]|uniref:Caspase family protein n=1 Tax=Variovorax terrae TaxID=2923278 RepID=A0A9X2AME5_9BURK|nr:caspase family protein [Variovorax terrae]MCJ0763249.1 caspase family protein [Variovorax terrae]
MLPLLPSAPIRLKGLCALICLASVAAGAQAPGDARVALVIGNGAYASAPALPNPANDAGAMASTLKGLGFTVIELRDGTKAQMAEAIARVRETLKGRQGVGMLYYAGHGLQMDARNYMVPVDARMARTADVPQQTVDVSSVIEAFKAAGNRMNILVLDACRDNPFGGITTGRGLAPLDAPSGTFLAYATAPGNVAEDGDVKSGNGLYTQFLLQELKKPQARIEDVFKRVRFAVRKASNGRQIPWESTSLEDDFQFNEGRVIAAARPTAQQLQAEFTQEKQDWDRIKDSTRADDFYAFLQKYPSGSISEAALARLNQINQPTLLVQGAGADGSDKPYARATYKLGDEFESAYEGGTMRLIQRVTSVTPDEVAVTSRAVIDGKEQSHETVELFDPSGGSRGIKGMYRYNPPQTFFPAEQMQVGKSWKVGFETVGTLFGSFPSHTINGEARVLARETLQTPAGAFSTFKIEWVTYSSLKAGQATRCLFWLSQDVPVAVRSECSVPASGTSPARQVVQLVRVKRAS